MIPIAELKMESSGSTPCAALPANKARAGSPRNRFAKRMAGFHACEAQPCQKNGMLGYPQRRQRVAKQRVGSIDQRLERGPECRPVLPELARGHEQISPSRNRHVRPSRGCATATSGWSQRRPLPSRSSVRKNGEPIPIG